MIYFFLYLLGLAVIFLPLGLWWKKGMEARKQSQEPGKTTDQTSGKEVKGDDKAERDRKAMISLIGLAISFGVAFAVFAVLREKEFLAWYADDSWAFRVSVAGMLFIFFALFGRRGWRHSGMFIAALFIGFTLWNYFSPSKPPKPVPAQMAKEETSAPKRKHGKVVSIIVPAHQCRIAEFPPWYGKMRGTKELDACLGANCDPRNNGFVVQAVGYRGIEPHISDTSRGITVCNPHDTSETAAFIRIR